MAEVCGRNVCLLPKPQEIPVNLYKSTAFNVLHVSHQSANFTFTVTSAQFRGITLEVSHKILKTILFHEKNWLQENSPKTFVHSLPKGTHGTSILQQTLGCGTVSKEVGAGEVGLHWA